MRKLTVRSAARATAAAREYLYDRQGRTAWQIVCQHGLRSLDELYDAVIELEARAKT